MIQKPKNKNNIELVSCWPSTAGHGWGLPIRVVYIPSETSLEKTIFSFANGYQLMIASELGMGLVSTSPLSSGSPSGLDHADSVRPTVVSVHHMCVSPSASRTP